MDLREYFSTVATTYDREAGMSAPTQVLLRHANEHLRAHVPAGFLVKGSGGAGSPTSTPWVGIFDPDETTSPQSGMYVVYLFTTDLETLFLSLLQGITRLTRELGFAGASRRLESESREIREALTQDSVAGLSTSMDLNPAGQKVKLDRQKGYAAANIVSIEYAARSLPPERRLQGDLDRFLGVYQDAVAARRRLLPTTPDVTGSQSTAPARETSDDLRLRFKPKNDSDYRARISGGTLVKSRRHERLVRDYGVWAQGRGFAAGTPHPRDLVLQRDGREWLIEAKIVYRGNATNAVRAALGQLYAYRHFLYETPPALVALFSEPVGDAYVGFLEGCGIRTVWWERGFWLGSLPAHREGLCEVSSDHADAVDTRMQLDPDDDFGSANGP